MIPPVLREQLVRKLTQKLVESPTFNTLVHNTQGTISAFLDGIDEGRKEKAAAEMKKSDINEQTSSTSQQQQQHGAYRHPYQQQQDHSTQSQQQPSSQPTYSRMHDFEKPRSTNYIDPRTPKPAPPEQEASSSTSSASSSSSDSGPTDLEVFLRRTKASLEEAERRADAQRKNKS